MITLRHHQKLPIQFIKNNFGLILYHSVGSGKTITSLVGMNQHRKEIIIIGPKSSHKAFLDEIKKLNYNRNRFQIYTFHKAKKLVYNNINFFSDKCTIVDEAHHLRNLTKDNIYLIGSLSMSYRIMLLTATPVVNYLNDISALVNIIKGDDTLPTERPLFNFYYFDEQNLEIINTQSLLQKLSNCISYYQINMVTWKKYYPEQKIFYISVAMNEDQLKEYMRYVKKLIWKNNPPPRIDLTEVDFKIMGQREKNFFLGATRQLSNTINNKSDSPKIHKIFSYLQKGPYPKLVYSNFLKNGLYPLAKLLDQNTVSHRLITGNTNPDKLIKIVDDYNQGKFKVLLISSAGSESLDLKNTRQIHVMEPHWNDAKIRQVVGRAIRYKSHFVLPSNSRIVETYHWISIFPAPFKNKSADEYLLEISKKKQEIYEAFHKIIVKASIENINI